MRKIKNYKLTSRNAKLKFNNLNQNNKKKQQNVIKQTMKYSKSQRIVNKSKDWFKENQLVLVRKQQIKQILILNIN